MIRRLLCWLGFHAWGPWLGNRPRRRRCRHCAALQLEDDR